MVHHEGLVTPGERFVVIIEAKLSRVRFRLDQAAHIKVDSEVCESSSERPCLYVCPVQNYRLAEDGCVEFSWQGCMECGACRIICNKGAISWNLPRGGFGVCLRYG